MNGYASVLLRLRWPVVALATLVMLAMAPGARFIGVTNDYRSFFDDDNPQLVALHALEATYTTSKFALIAVAPKSGSVFTRETLGAIEELTEGAWRTPWSIRVDSLTNHPHSEAVGDDLRVAALVDDASSLDDAELARIEEVALSASEIAGRLVSGDGRVGGLLVSFNPPENADAAVAEIMVLVGVFRDLRLGLVSLVPNFLPAAMSFGLWGYMIGRIGLAASVVAAMTFGIIVDDTIHFLCRYRKARLEGQPASAAVQYTFRSVGRALWTTTIVLALGFLVFASSGFELSWALGLLVTITIVFAILTDFLLLPPLLMAIDRKQR